MPKLSILTACYNHKQFLAESLSSSLATAEDIEVIYVDDGSTDGSVLVARDFSDPRLLVIRLRRNAGLANALNVAIRASSSDWLLKVDADDMIHPDYVGAILRAAELVPKLNVIYSPARLFGLESYDYRYKDFDPKRMIDEFMIPGPSAFRFELWRAVGGFDESLRFAEDWDFWVRAQIAVGLNTLQFNDAMWFYRQHAGPRMSREGGKHLDQLKAHMRSHTRESIERKAWEAKQMYGDGRGTPKGFYRSET